MADDLITFRTIRGSAEFGLDREGGEAILEELAEGKTLAPRSLFRSYGAVESAIESLLAQIDASPTRAPRGTASPTPSDDRQATSTPTPTADASVPEVVEASAADLDEWLRSNCTGL